MISQYRWHHIPSKPFKILKSTNSRKLTQTTIHMLILYTIKQKSADFIKKLEIALKEKNVLLYMLKMFCLTLLINHKLNNQDIIVLVMHKQEYVIKENSVNITIYHFRISSSLLLILLAKIIYIIKEIIM